MSATPAELTNPCPCSSGYSYQQCCYPYHNGKKPKDVLSLMRSRYSAYALDLPNYIIETTHPASLQYQEDKTKWSEEISQFSRACAFDKLEILDVKQDSFFASVTFTAHLRQGECDATFTENSLFEKRGEDWLYRSGLLEEGHAPNLITTEPLAILPLAYYGAVVLEKRAEEVKEITPDVKSLVTKMIATMEAFSGVGIAAPQVHHSIRIFVIRAPKEDRTLGEPQVFINPKIFETSTSQCTLQEGCLSIPSIYGDVERPEEVTLEYTQLDGRRECKTFSGWEARIILHEYDHIEGILFLERMSIEEKKRLSSSLESLKKRIEIPLL